MGFGGGEMKVAVGVPTMKNFKGLAELFASLWGEEYTPFVVNNWTYNNGVSKGWNAILKATKDYDLTIICNDDITFHGGSFEKLVWSWDWKPENALMITAVNGNHNAEINDPWMQPSPDYSCFMINAKEYLDVVGLFDENFTPAYFEDNDSHYRIKLAGYEAYNCGLAKITHKGSQTQNYDKPVVTPQMFEKNREYYKTKWGGVPGEEKHKNPYNNPDLSLKDWYKIGDVS